MSEDQAKYNITLPDGVREIIHRTGPAPALNPPKSITLSGDIETPREMHRLRWPVKDCYVIANEEKGTIQLFIYPETPDFTHIIRGEMSLHKVIDRLYINTGTRNTPEALSKLLQMHRTYFVDQDEYMKVVAGLKTLKGKINTEIERISDARGNRRELVDKVVSTNIPQNFTLALPVFVGSEPASFLIDIEIESREQEISCLLTSIELNDYIRVHRETRIHKELLYFNEYKIPVIYQ